MEASDADNDSISYSMVPTTAGSAATYFYIYENTGRIVLIKPLPADYDQDFDFQVRVADDSIPSKSFLASVKGEKIGWF